MKTRNFSVLSIQTGPPFGFTDFLSHLQWPDISLLGKDLQGQTPHHALCKGLLGEIVNRPYQNPPSHYIIANEKQKSNNAQENGSNKR